MAWKDDTCLIFSYLEAALSPSEHEFIETEADESYLRLEEKAREVPVQIKSATPEELAAELVSFAKREFTHEERIWISRAAEFFWEEKGITTKWNIPSDIRLKLEKAETLAQQQIHSEREAELKAQLEKEKAELPHLISQCVVWARKQGLSRLTQADVDAFLLEQEKEILPQTKRAIYATANVQLKSASKR
jgi:hypothetical protein